MSPIAVLRKRVVRIGGFRRRGAGGIGASGPSTITAPVTLGGRPSTMSRVAFARPRPNVPIAIGESVRLQTTPIMRLDVHDRPDHDDSHMIAPTGGQMVPR